MSEEAIRGVGTADPLVNINPPAILPALGGMDVSTSVLPLQQASRIVAAKHFGPGEDVDGMRMRLAQTLAKAEARPSQWEEPFYWALQYAFPGGRIMANAGLEHIKPGVSTINCTVSRTIEDSMAGIMQAATEAALTLKAGCGIGYDFSTLRPKGAFVKGAGSTTSGVLPFMDIFNAVCKTVSSAGGRRGAQMGVLDVGHPDIEDFIVAKRRAGRLRAFNLSTLVTSEFLDCLKTDGDWALAFPAFPHELQAGTFEVVWRRHPGRDPKYTLNELGQTCCRVYRKVKARDLWSLIMRSTYDYSDPGFILIDEYNAMNTLWFIEYIRATNPCGEQGLPPWGACLLGSVNLASLVNNPFSANAHFDFETYRKVVRIFSRMLDNVVEINGLPLPEQRNEITRKRRHGMGYLGLGSAMTMLGMPYGSPRSVEFTREVTRDLAVESWRAGLELAIEKGPAPIMNETFEVTPAMQAQNPSSIPNEMVGYKVPGRVLHAASRYMQRIATVDKDLVSELAKIGARYTHATSLAPTGTMASGVGNNASNGIEPSFGHSYIRNMNVPGEKAKRALRMESYELQVYRKVVNPDVDPDNLPSVFDGTTSEADPVGHIDVQAAAQEWIDSSISKTINVPTDISFEKFQDLYNYGIQKGLKGCTTFRFNPEVHQGVLVRKSDLANTEYEFKLADGTSVVATGDQEVEYEGSVFTAANLFDAHKEDFYGEI